MTRTKDTMSKTIRLELAESEVALICTGLIGVSNELKKNVLELQAEMSDKGGVAGESIISLLTSIEAIKDTNELLLSIAGQLPSYGQLLELDKARANAAKAKEVLKDLASLAD
jgi:hypothetical protein